MISTTSSASLSTYTLSSSPSAVLLMSSPTKIESRPTLASLSLDSFEQQQQARQVNNLPLSAIHSSTPSSPEKHVCLFSAMTSSSSPPHNAAAATANHLMMTTTTENNNSHTAMPPSPALAPFHHHPSSQYNLPSQGHGHGHFHPSDGADTSGFYYVYPPMPPPMSDDACQPPMPDASLLFGTPAPTRVPTAAPTVASSPSKTFLGFGRFGGPSASSGSSDNSSTARRGTETFSVGKPNPSIDHTSHSFTWTFSQ
ncbi:hypothetical protein BCR44DRAFT_393558 [Catenaria anguillulae PL171]|uniref:Uncharacterized protein n=1 Tax=Catenaria anguillulae PL171 TaxID=765915 RepID=A0A1Y2HIJ8_9FUNG|nr:hypothetical protein BCR44DRAFT_393558 [Catenaria anguillulae PL171]